MTALDTVADRQAQWSKTANSMKSMIDKARWWVFLLSALGAVLAAVASQLAGGNSAATVALDNPRAWVAITATVCLAFATFFTQRLLGADHVTAWVRARAIAERLKREAYKFAARAAPYDNADPAKCDSALNDERAKIEVDGDDLVQHLVQGAGPGSAPRTTISDADYLQKRVVGQMKWYNEKSDTFAAMTKRLRVIELILAAAATLITAIAGIAGKSILGIPFDAAAFTAVLTTLAGAVLAHVEASRYDFLVMAYRATARRLEDRRNRSQQPWSDFVNDCENILSAENTSWIAKWTK
jgi:Zn-dependent protease with chaperone function